MDPVARLALASLLLVLSGCRSDPAQQPPQLSGALCASCNHIIEDERFAAQYRLSSGAIRSFDEPTCLFRALRRESGDPSVIRFRDHTSDRWLGADAVWFARTPAITTPRGGGWTAFASFAAAQDAVTAAGSGEILSYEQATQEIGAE